MVNVKSAGVSLEYPSTWAVVPVTKRVYASNVKAFAKSNPKLAAVLADIPTDVSKFKFFATSVAAVSGIHSNVSVQVGASTHGITLAKLTDELREGFKLAGATLVDAKSVKVSGKSAYRIDLAVPLKNTDGMITSKPESELLIPGLFQFARYRDLDR